MASTAWHCRHVVKPEGDCYTTREAGYPRKLGSHPFSVPGQAGHTGGVATKQPAGDCCCHRGGPPPALPADQGDKVPECQRVADAGAGLRDVGTTVVCQTCGCGRHGCCDGACHGIPWDHCVGTSRRTKHDVTHTCIAAGQYVEGCLAAQHLCTENSRGHQHLQRGRTALKADNSK